MSPDLIFANSYQQAVEVKLIEMLFYSAIGGVYEVRPSQKERYLKHDLEHIVCIASKDETVVVFAASCLNVSH